MKYLLLVCTDPGAEPYDPTSDNIGEWVGEAEALGYRKDGQRLEPPEKARTVKVRSGEILVSAGPFAETKGGIAGFDILECPSFDEAVRIASRHPMARFGQIEVRAFWPMG